MPIDGYSCWCTVTATFCRGSQQLCKHVHQFLVNTQSLPHTVVFVHGVNCNEHLAASRQLRPQLYTMPLQHYVTWYDLVQPNHRCRQQRPTTGWRLKILPRGDAARSGPNDAKTSSSSSSSSLEIHSCTVQKFIVHKVPKGSRNEFLKNVNSSSSTVSQIILFYRGSQDFVWGCTFLPKKLTTFLVVALKDRLNIPPTVKRAAKTVLTIDSCSGWGMHFVSWGCTYTFSL